MGKVAKTWASFAIVLVGVGLTYVYPPAGVAVTSVATVATLFALFGLNVPASRVAFVLALIANGGAVFLATRSWQLAAAVTLPLWLAVPNEVAMRRGLMDFMPPIALLSGLVLLGLAWSTLPSPWWALVMLPHVLLTGMVTMTTVSYRKFQAGARSKVAIGEPLPVSVQLPTRDGKGVFSLDEQRGSFVLLAFVRGDWCPMCHVMMRIISKESATLNRHGVKVALISPTEEQMDDETVAQLALEPGMLFDKGSALAFSLGLVDMDKKNGKDVPMPVTVLVDKQGIVRHVTRPDDVAAYASDTKVMSFLEALPA